MNENDYATRQMLKDREYSGCYDTPEALAWIATLSPAERQSLEVKGLLRPMLDRCGSTTRQEAIKYAVGANRTDKLRRSNEDKRWCVVLALKEFSSQSDSKLSEMCGVDGKTVAAARKHLESTSEIPKSNERTGKDGRKCKLPERKEEIPAHGEPAPEPAPPAPDAATGSARPGPPDERI